MFSEHSRPASTLAAERFELIHRRHGVPDDVPVFHLRADDRALGAENGEVWLPRLLVRMDLAPSTSQAVRLIEQGAVSVDGEKVEGREFRLPVRGEYTVQKGKRFFARVEFSVAPTG